MAELWYLSMAIDNRSKADKWAGKSTGLVLYYAAGLARLLSGFVCRGKARLSPRPDICFGLTSALGCP